MAKNFDRAAFQIGEPAQIDKVTISSAATDTGNTGTTHILRAGLVLGKITTGGEYSEYKSTNSDGTQLVANCLVLLEDVDLKNGDLTATSVDRIGRVAIIARVKESGLIGLDAAAKAALIPGGAATAQYTFE